MADKASRRIDRLDTFARMKGLNDSIITKQANLAVGTLGKSRKEGKDLTPRTLTAILTAYPEINPDWLTGGVGEMLVDDIKPGFKQYPYIDNVGADCGLSAGMFEAERMALLPKLALPGIPGETEFFMQSTGYSMINREHPELSIPPGSLIGLSRINRNIMRWGEIYAVATSDGVMVKRIYPDDDPDKIRCVSYNATDYPEFKIDKKDVLDLARITCVVPVYVR